MAFSLLIKVKYYHLQIASYHVPDLTILLVFCNLNFHPANKFLLDPLFHVNNSICYRMGCREWNGKEKFNMKKMPKKRICSVSKSLEILGDRWVFLILREAFFGVRQYDQFHANLGIATNILSSRLKLLVKNGILERKKDTTDARRFRYKLTEKGIDLYPITLAFMRWGDRWLSGEEGPPLLLKHKTCGHLLEPEMCCSFCRETIHARDVEFNECKFESSPKKN